MQIDIEIDKETYGLLHDGYDLVGECAIYDFLNFKYYHKYWSAKAHDREWERDGNITFWIKDLFFKKAVIKWIDDNKFKITDKCELKIINKWKAIIERKRVKLFEKKMCNKFRDVNIKTIYE